MNFLDFVKNIINAKKGLYTKRRYQHGGTMAEFVAKKGKKIVIGKIHGCKIQDSYTVMVKSQTGSPIL